MGRSRIFMDLKRFFSDCVDWDKRTAVLRDEEFYHAVKVTRHKVGYKLVICNGDDFDYNCEVTEITKDALYARIESRTENKTELKNPVVLYIGVNKEIDTVVQKAVEMGVRKIVPFTSAHSNVDKINIERLNKIVVESSKQCGRNRLAEICPLVTYKEALFVAKDTNILFYYEYERNNKTCDVSIDDREISVFIGSEGGFSSDEVAYAKEAGAKLLTLGDRILRVSTAVVSALTLVIERRGEI